MSALQVQLQRPTNFAEDSPPHIDVNVVAVNEVDCPAGQVPIAWYLVTSEPIATNEDVAAIVDAYRARWVVEELFKALKTGCQFEKRQLESFGSLKLALAIFLPIAARLLALRSASRMKPDAVCTGLTPVQVALLRRCTNKVMSASPTNREVYAALAAFGGHLPSNGAPGWLVLGRAYDRLLLLERGWNEARKSAEDPIDD